MAYMNPQQYLKAITGIGRGSRYTAFEDPNEADPNEILKVTGPYQARRGAPNFSGSRGPTYDKIPIQQASTGTGLTSLQKGLEQFNQQQQGFVADRPQVPPMSEQPSLYPSDIGQAAPGYGYGPSVPQGSDDPRGMMSKIGGFFNRPGAARDIGAALTSLGAGLGAESSRPGGSAWAGLASGANLATESLARSREEARLEEERAVVAAERARETKVREDLQAALTTMAETGELTPDQIQVSLRIGSSDPAAGMAAMEGFKTENATTAAVTNFLAELDPDALERLEASGRAALLRGSSSVFSNDQKLDMMMTIGSEAERRENAIDSLLWKLHNIDHRSLATEEQLEQAEYIAQNAEYAELMLRSPLNWDVIDDGNQVHYVRDDKLIESFDKAVDDPVVSPIAMVGFEEFYTDERDAGRRELYTWKRGLEAVDNLKDEDFGERARGLRRAWKTFQNYTNSGLTRGEALANLEASWAQLGFANLSSFVGPTSDYEFGIAQALSGTRDLTRTELKKHMEQLYRQKLDDIAIHNDRLLRQVPDEEIRDLYLIRLSPEDFYEDTRRYFENQLGSEQSTEGHRILLSGVRSWTGALQELGPDRVPRTDAVPRPGTVSSDPIIARPDSLQAVTEPDSTTVNRRFLYPDSTMARPDSLQATFDTLSAPPDSVTTPGGHRGRMARLRQRNGLLNGAGGQWIRTGEERGFGNPLRRNMFKWERRDEFGKLLDRKWIKDEDVPWLN